MTTPPAGSIDPRRIGLSNTASYWGGGGEQIDTLTGNLHFGLPLLSAMGRAGWTVPLGMVYDSQNWRNDNGTNWQLGGDVGFGFGWRMVLGSITPYYSQNWAGADHYVFTDGTGAEYRLDVNNNGVWSSSHGAYVWFDSFASILHFKDGTFWTMGSVSGGQESDAGTMYPTIIEDVSGNQVIVTYDTETGLSSSPNTSSRITAIEDVRANQNLGQYLPGYWPAMWVTYWFTYDRPACSGSTCPVPHLQSFLNTIGTGEKGTFTYNLNSPLAPPFGSDPNFAGATTVQLASISSPLGVPYQFTYDTAGASELAQVTFPWGGHLRWGYSSDPYIGNRELRAVTSRYLAADSGGTHEWTYSLTRDNASGATVHATTTLADAAGLGAKTWKFLNPPSPSLAWQIGLISEFTQTTATGGQVYTDDTYTWAQNPSAAPYISAKVSVTDPGTANAQTAKSTQAQDQYGNVTQTVIYPYNNTTTALKTYNSTYLNAAANVQYYTLNRLAATTLTAGGPPITLLQNSYGGSISGGTLPTREMDPFPPVPASQRMYLGTSATPAVTMYYQVDNLGVVRVTTGSDGSMSSGTTGSATNYALPSSISTQSYGESLAYSSFLGVTQTTGLNGEQLSLAYDGLGKVLSATSPYGATWNYSYNATTLPVVQSKSGPDGFITNTLDGLGRTIRTLTWDGTHTGSQVDTVYAPCACSPLGKIQRVSTPYPSNQSATNWTTYTYDGIGRTLSVTQPDGYSTTSYFYTGNQTKVTDPAGNWKQFTSDVEGNLTSVVEPDPANQPGGTLTTSYTYDWMKHVTQVTMPRGAVTQTRTFAYDNGGRLTSATNPENGTVNYTWNADNTLQKKQDAKGQSTTYTYDSAKRVTLVQTPDSCGAGKTTYSYDTNPVSTSFSQYAQGRLTAVQYTVCGSSLFGPTTTQVAEMYSYHPAGGVMAKQVALSLCGNDSSGNWGCTAWEVEADYTYTMAGQVASYGTSYFNGQNSSLLIFNYTYDTMGRPTTLTDSTSRVWAQGGQYDFAGRMTGLQTAATFSQYGSATFDSRTMTWNASGQLASLNWVGSWSSGALQYSYSGTQNNGQITRMVDTASGETITYQYDALKRLTLASGTPNTGSTPAAWTQSYSYDGFGNLTGKKLNGVAGPIAVDGTTNRLVGAFYDGNGNMTAGTGATLTYDAENRITTAAIWSGGTESYGYSPDNKRVTHTYTNGVVEWTLYGAQGEKLGTYDAGGFSTNTVWFAGRLINENANVPYSSYDGDVFQDRLGTNRAGGARFYPYGDEITSTSNDRVKYGTYRRDSFTGLDYADQRYYASSYGRFATADPYKASAGTSDPGSWNRYSYTRGDPVNRNDRRGLEDCGGSGLDGPTDCTDDGGSGDDGSGGDGGGADCGPAWFQDASLQGPCGGSGYGGGGGGAIGGTAPPPPCWDDGGKVHQTLEDLASNIEEIAGARISNGAELSGLNSLIQGTISGDMASLLGNIATGSSSPPSFYVGGHFNLDLSTAALRGVLQTDYAQFEQAFGGTIDGKRQRSVYGNPAQGNYTLHSRQHQGTYDIHFDIYNPLSGNPLNLIGHLFGDVIGGHIGSPCLDPAWN